MNLVIYSHAFAPLVGGVETYVQLLAQGLAQSAANVTLVTPTPAADWDDANPSFRVIRQPGFSKLFNLLRRADVIHLAGPSLLPLWLAILLRKPIVIEHHGYQAICPNGLLLFEPTGTVCPGYFMAGQYAKCVRCNAPKSGWLRSLVQLLLTFPRRLASQLATANVPITRHVESRITLPRSRVIYYGLPGPGAEPETNAPANASRGRSGPPVFAFVGRLVSEKGLPVLLQAAAQLRDRGCSFHLKIIGDGAERAALEETAAMLGINSQVSFLGSLTGQPLLDELELATAVVMPSVWEETAGLSAIEQMMRGGLVIAADIGGLGEVVGEAGLKFAAGDVEGLTSCLRRVLDDPSLATLMGGKARERAEELFSQQRMVQEHLGLYGEISGGLRRESLQTS